MVTKFGLAIVSVLATGIVFGSGKAASAATLDAQTLLNHYALITRGDFYSTIEVEGNIYIGGDASGTFNYDQGDPTDGSSTLADAVIVGTNSGQIKGVAGSSTVYVGTNTGFMENAGDVYYGTNTGTIQNVSSSTMGAPSADIAPDSADVFAALDGLASDYAGMAATTTYTTDASSQTYVFGAGVYWLDFADLSYSNVAFDLAEDELAIINVTGTNVSTNLNFDSSDFDFADQVVWNFVEATDLYLGGSAFTGVVLAGNAYVTGFTGSTEGTIYAGSVSQTSGEIHGAGFIGESLPAVPLPASLPLLVGAFGAFGVLRRKQKKAA